MRKIPEEPLKRKKKAKIQYDSEIQKLAKSRTLINQGLKLQTTETRAGFIWGDVTELFTVLWAWKHREMKPNPTPNQVRQAVNASSIKCSMFSCSAVDWAVPKKPHPAASSCVLSLIHKVTTESKHWVSTCYSVLFMEKWQENALYTYLVQMLVCFFFSFSRCFLSTFFWMHRCETEKYGGPTVDMCIILRIF